MVSVHTSGVGGLGQWLSVLAILSLLAAVGGCGPRDGLSDAQRERNKKEDLAGSLREQGATVTTKHFQRLGTCYVVDLIGAQLTDRMFQDLKELKKVTELDLSKSSLTDEQMDQLNEVATVLLKLDLSNTKVTDAGLDKLTNLKSCMNLNLVGTQVTPAGAKRFEQQHARSPNSMIPIPPMKVRLR